MELNAKIFLVVAILAVIFAGIILYLFLMDRRIGNLEKESREKKSEDNR